MIKLKYAADIEQSTGKKMKRKVFVRTTMLLVMIFSLSAVIFSASGQAIEEVPREQLFWCVQSHDNVDTLNPFSPAGHPDATTQFIVYEWLAYVDYNDGLLHPMLAESWGYVNEGSTFEIKLRPIAHFWDGTPLTADDVIFSLETMADPVYSGVLTATWEIVDSAEKVDDLTVHINLKEGEENSLQVMGVLVEPIVQMERWAALKESLGETFRDFMNTDLEEIVGTGPYQPIAYEDRYIFYQRVDDYWGEQIGWTHNPEYVKYEGVADDAACSRLLRDFAVEYAWGSLLERDIEWHKANQDKVSVWNVEEPPEKMLPPTGPYWLFPNLENPMVRQTWLREALMYTIDPLKLSLASYAGTNILSRFPLQVAPGGLADMYLNREVVEENFKTEPFVLGGVTFPSIKLDPEYAIELLEAHCEGSVEAGWTYEGEPVGPFRILGVAGWGYEPQAIKIAEWWNEIGIPTEAVNIEYTLWEGMMMNREGFDWVVLTPNGGVAGLNLIQSAMFNEFVHEDLNPWVGSRAHYQDYWSGDYPELENTAAQVRELAEQLWKVPTGTEESIRIAKEIQAIIIPQMYAIPLMIRTEMNAQWCKLRWVNWPKGNEIAPMDSGQVQDVKGVYFATRLVNPAVVKLVDFRISPSTVREDETATAIMTIKNEGQYPHMYDAELYNITDKPQYYDMFAMKHVTVQPGETMNVMFEIKRPVGTYEISAGEYDPGLGIRRIFTVVPAVEVPGIEEAIAEATAAKTAAEDARSAAEQALTAAQDAKALAEAAKAAAEGLQMMVIGSAVATIVVVLIGVYALTRR